MSKGFKGWWEKNRDKYNAARRKRYKKDKAYREAVLQQNAKYRSTHERERPPREIARDIDGKKIPVFTIGQAAEMAGVTAQTIRLWERKGRIPKPIFGRRNRVYTENQVSIMKRLAHTLGTYKTAYLKSNSKLRAKLTAIKKQKVAALQIVMERTWGEL